MEEKINRYEYDPLNGCMAKKEDGAWVAYQDYKTLQSMLLAEIDRLKGELEESEQERIRLRSMLK